MHPSLTSLFGRFMFDLDRASDQLLQSSVGISYRRFLFLTVLHHTGTVTQHQLAQALGYSDPAVSTMLVELAREGYVQTIQSPHHARKRLVTLTPSGSAVAAQGRHVLDEHFDLLLQNANIDARQFHELIQRLYQELKLHQEKN